MGAWGARWTVRRVTHEPPGPSTVSGLFVGAVYIAAKAAAYRERLRAAGLPEDYIAAAHLAAFVIAAGVAVLGTVAWWNLPA